MEYLNTAKKIFKSLGGKRFALMTRAKLSYGKDKYNIPYLQCNLPNDIVIKDNINQLIISYDNKCDLYNLSFINSNNYEKTIVEQVNRVYAEEIVQVFEQETGMSFCCLGSLNL